MLIASFRRVIYPANRDRLTGAPLQRRRDVELMFLGRRHVGAVDLRSPLRLHFDHELVAPPLRRGLGASALALDLLSVRVQVEDPLAVVDADLVRRLGDRQRFRRLEEAAHGAAPTAGAVAAVGVAVPAAAPAEAAPGAAGTATTAAYAAAPPTHAAPSTAEAATTRAAAAAAARVVHLRPRVLALILVQRPLAGQRRRRRRGVGTGLRRPRGQARGRGERRPQRERDETPHCFCSRPGARRKRIVSGGPSRTV